MTRIAVTGASGFVGGHLCRRLATHGIESIPLPRPLLSGRDLLDKLCAVDAVIHLAARVHRLRDEAPDPARAFYADNVLMTQHLATVCRTAGVRRFVFVSSAGVLGNASPPGGFGDDSVPEPHDDYTRSKLAAEQMLQSEFRDDLQVAILRPPMVYGPDAPGNFRRILQAVLSGWPLPVGRLHVPRSMISVRNLCDVLVLTATTATAVGRPLLVSDQEVTTVADLVRAIASAAGRRARIVDVPISLLAMGLRAAGHGTDVARLLLPFVVKGTLASRELAWAPQHALAEELRWTVQTTNAGV